MGSFDDLYPSLCRYFQKVFPLDEERQALALVYSWHLYKCGKATNIPRAAVIAIRAGRDLPRLYPHSTQQDAMEHCWQGAGMKEVRDRQPLPDKVAMLREMVAKLISLTHDELERNVIDLILDGVSQKDIARQLGISPSTVMAIKKRLRERW